jgi:hypothetical protein
VNGDVDVREIRSPSVVSGSQGRAQTGESVPWPDPSDAVTTVPRMALAASFSDWLGVIQAALTAIALIFAYLTVKIAYDSKTDSDKEKRRTRLLEVRAILSEIRRLYEYGGLVPYREKEKRRLAAQLRTVAGTKRYPKTAKIIELRVPDGILNDAGFAMLAEADEEIDHALDAAFAS